MQAPSASEASIPEAAPRAASVAVEQLNRRCCAEDLPFRTTAEIAGCDGVIAQERALAALELAMRISSWSHNVYVMGSPARSRKTGD